MNPGNFFSGQYLDRRAEERGGADWLAEARADADTLYVAMRGTMALVHPPASETGGSTAAFLSADDPRTAIADPERQVLLGWFRGRRCLLLELDADAAEREGERFAELRPLACDLPADEAGLLAYARALSIWRGNHRFCSRCGAPTLGSRAGHARRCTGCDHESFPRIDPAIIVLVECDGRALLGRQPGWPQGRYSTIAGFVEPGESLEDAVRREVQEETGIVVTQVDYHSSQPWPFPSSLMLGFLARGEYATPATHDAELEDARWFTREQIESGAVGLPPRESISRRLIEHWLRGGTTG